MNNAHIISSDLNEVTQVQATLLETGLFEEVGYSSTLGEYRRVVKRDPGLKVVLVSSQIRGVSWIETVKEIIREDVLSPVVLLTDNRDDITVADAMNAGISEVLPLTPSLEEYLAKLERITERLETVNRRLTPTETDTESLGHLEVFFGAKGGVGTSLQALLFARFWAQYVKTCLVDLDLFKGDLASYCSAHPRRSIVDLAEISGELSGRSIAEVAHTLDCGIDLIAAPKDAEQAERVDEMDMRLIISALRFSYDLVVIDCGSRIWDVPAVAIEAADEVAIVTTPELPSIRNVRSTVNNFERLELTLGSSPRLLFNRSNKKAEIQPELGSKMTGLSTVSVTSESKNLEAYMNASTLLEAKTPGWDQIYRAMWETQPIRVNINRKEKRRKKAREEKKHGRRAVKKAEEKEKESGQATVEGTAAIVLFLGLIVVCSQILLWGISHIIAYSAAEEGARLAARGADYSLIDTKVDNWVPGFWDAAPRTDVSPANNTVTVSITTPGLAQYLLDDVTYTIEYVSERER